MKMLLALDDTAALAAARKLKAKCEVRKHIFMDADQRESNAQRAVVVDGVRYPSMRKAAAAHNRSCECLRKWIERGKAEYAED